MEVFPSIRLAELHKRRWSVVPLLAVNLLPLLGVLLLGWRAFDVVFVYWLENVVIGALNVLKIATCWPEIESGPSQELDEADSGDQEPGRASLADPHALSQAAMQGSKLFLIPFFTCHYGIFCAVHGVFVCVLLGGDDGGPALGGDPLVAMRDALGSTSLLIAAFGLAASHLASYFINFLFGGEYRRTSPPELMMQPYPRIIVLHVAIVASGFVTVVLGSPIALLVLLVIGKTALDLALHLREHRTPPAVAST